MFGFMYQSIEDNFLGRKWSISLNSFYRSEILQTSDIKLLGWPGNSPDLIIWRSVGTLCAIILQVENLQTKGHCKK
jgi:hypothetical protein